MSGLQARRPRVFYEVVIITQGPSLLVIKKVSTLFRSEKQAVHVKIQLRQPGG